MPQQSHAAESHHSTIRVVPAFNARARHAHQSLINYGPSAKSRLFKSHGTLCVTREVYPFTKPTTVRRHFDAAPLCQTTAHSYKRARCFAYYHKSPTQAVGEVKKSGTPSNFVTALRLKVKRVLPMRVPNSLINIIKCLCTGKIAARRRVDEVCKVAFFQLPISILATSGLATFAPTHVRSRHDYDADATGEL